MKILITGVGGASGIGLTKILRSSHDILGVDSNPDAPGQTLVDAYEVVPEAPHPEYLSELKSLAQGRDALFCTVDEELPILSASKSELSCGVLISDSKSVENCLNKKKCMGIIADNGFEVPETLFLDDAGFEEIEEVLGLPFLIKPNRGRGSRNIFLVRGRRDYDYWRGSDIDFIAQEYLPGVEYSADVLLNEKSTALAAVIRERIATDSGISTVGRTLEAEEIRTTVEDVSETMNLKYIVNVQVKYGKEGNPKITEINPRPAGTLILTVESGINMPELSLKIWRGEEISEDELDSRSGITMYRYPEEKFRGDWN